MGYRSDMVIGITKELWAEHQILPHIPDALLGSNVVRIFKESAVYFVIEGWRWYESFPEVREIEKWFNNLEDDSFGAMRIGENDDDIETWGYTGDFDIWLNRSISHPT